MYVDLLFFVDLLIVVASSPMTPLELVQYGCRGCLSTWAPCVETSEFVVFRGCVPNLSHCLG